MASIDDWLNGVGLGVYAKAFVANDVDLRILPQLNSDDLKELGVSLGHRKILLAAIAELQAATAANSPVGLEEQGSLTPAGEHRSDSRPEATADKGPDLRLISVLFCDMVDSTNLAAQFGPEEMHEVITRYQDAVSGAITRYGGYVAKFLGDGVLAYFGWPLADEDHAERAIRAGLSAVTAVEMTTTPNGVPLRSRVGIASGRVVVGDIAGGGVLDRGQVAGETPNLAARLQSVAEPGQVVIANTTHRLVRHAFLVEDLGARELRGFQHPVPMFRIVGDGDAETRFDAKRGGSLTQFVGRQGEIAILLDRWALAKSGLGQVVFVSGEAGIGKSRLIEALIERLEAEPHELIRLQCSPYHAASALFPVIQRLNRAAGIKPSDDEPARGKKFDELITRYGEDLTEVGPVYAELLSLDLRDRFRPIDLPAQQRKELTLKTLVTRISLASQRATVLLVVEDAHWIDPSTNELLRDLVLRSYGLPICLVMTHRPEWSASWTPTSEPHSTRLTVGRLSKDQMNLLIRSMLGSVSDRLVARIADQTDGVPLFVEELTRSIRESGGDANENVDIPDSLQGSLMARLDRLPAPAKEIVQIASVIGREFDRRLLGQVSAYRDSVLDGALQQLLAAQLLVTTAMSDRFLLFRHALIQDTAYRSLLNRTRRAYHKKIADTLVSSHADIVATQPELVARHYAESQCGNLALPYWKRAGERALERSANYEAIDHLSNALALAEALPEGMERLRETLATRLRLADASCDAGRLIAATQHYVIAAEQARRVDDTDSFVRVALGYDTTQFLAGLPLNQSVDFLTEAEGKLGPHDDKPRCLILARLARAHLFLGDNDSSETFATQGATLARRLDDRYSLFNLFINRFLVPRQVASASDVETRLSELNELIALADGVDDESMARALSTDLYISTELGHRLRAERSLAAMRELGETRQRLVIQWVAQHGAAMLAFLDGDYQAAEAFARKALQLGRLTHGDQVEGVYGIQMFSIRREQGRLAEVAPVFKRLMTDQPGERSWLPGFALIATDLGFEAQARRRLHELAETGFDLPFDAKRSAALSYLAEVAARLDETEAAACLYELMSAYQHMTITAGVAAVCYGAASRYLGMLAGVLGEFDAAEAHFEHALDMNRRIGSDPYLGHTEAEYALLLRRQKGKGVSKRAEFLANEAWDIAARLNLPLLKRRLQTFVQ